MKVQVLSDIHLEHEDYEINHSGSDVVILAGDIHTKNRGIQWVIDNIKGKPVLYVLGNHEFYSKAYPKLISLIKEIAAGSNVTILEKDTITINGINFIGCTLWTDFELFGDARLSGYKCQQIMTDYKKIRVSPQFSKLRTIDVSIIHRQSLTWIKDELKKYEGQKNVVITHHAPSVRSLPVTRQKDKYSPAYVSNLELFIEEYSPDAWVHGHIHNSSDYMIGDCRIICNSRGYPDEPNPDFKDEFVFEI